MGTTSVNSQSQPYWDSGITSEMDEGNQIIIDFLVNAICQFEKYCPDLKQSQGHAEEYYSEWVKKQYEQLLRENSDGGSMQLILAGGSIIENLENVLFTIAESYEAKNKSFDYQTWKKAWRERRV